MNTDVAARIFHDWAAGEGLLAGEPAAPVTTTPAEMAAVTPITDAGKQLLRTKQILAVSFNEPRREIVVFTKRAVSTSKKALKTLPQSVDDVDVKYRQGAQDPIGQVPPQPFGSPPYVIRQAGGSACYTCGSSVSVGNFRDGGTLGCLVRNAAGEIFGLSNNHVYRRVQFRWSRPANCRAGHLRCQVEKVGRTTGHTHGRVISQMHGAFGVTYNSPLYGFTGVICFDPIFAIAGTAGDLFSDIGDSGSLITTIDGQRNRQAVGIVMGGMTDKSAPGGKATLALPLAPILQGFGVTLVSGHNL